MERRRSVVRVSPASPGRVADERWHGHGDVDLGAGHRRGPPRKLTSFTGEQIMDLAVSFDLKRLLVVRGVFPMEPVLITDTARRD